MNTNISLWRPFQRRRSNQSQEPGDALFQGLRVRLTLWYCAVLGTALVLFCIVVSLVARYALLNPIESGVAADAHRHAGQWSMSSPAQACLSNTPPNQFGAPPDNSMPRLLVCFDQNGTLLQGTDTTYLPSAFLNNTLAKTALQNGSAYNTVKASSTETIYLYAVAVPNSTGNGYIGVVVSGGDVQTQDADLSTLLIVLLSVGSVTLLGAGFGGLFLASRALVPARLAFTRQQQFIADASHELRTPLTLMRADAEVLLRGRRQMAAEDVALLEDIVAEANHMSTLANSMLTLARLDSNPQHHEQEVVSLVALTLQGVERVNAFAEQKGVIVQRETVNDAFVIGDPMQLEQAVLVLLDNSIKYNRPHGRVTVRTSVSDKQARLEVIDTGIGIASEHLSRLGERFYRVDKARSREVGGTGLGLSIAQRIAALHNGRLILTSVPDQGTTATLLLPLAAVTPSDKGDDDAVSKESMPEQTV
jgi:signal transduction histidine kinase